MRTRRSKLDIVRELLENVNRGYTSKSSLLKNLGLSVASLNSYITYAREKGLLEETERGYELTEKGKKVLEMLDEYSRLESKLLLIMEELYKELEEL